MSVKESIPEAKVLSPKKPWSKPGVKVVEIRETQLSSGSGTDSSIWS